eukprot:g2478.t1
MLSAFPPAVVAAVTGPGAPFEIVEEVVRYEDSTTGIHRRPQRLRVFKKPPPGLVLPDLYRFGTAAHSAKDFICYRHPKGITSGAAAGAAAAPVERYTFAEAHRLSSGLGAYLVDELGIRKGERVAVAMRNYPEWGFAFMAATSVGAVAVPTNSLWVSSELEYGMTDSGAAAIFCDGDRLDRLLPLVLGGKLPQLRAVVAGRCSAAQTASLRAAAASLSSSSAAASASCRVLELEEVLRASSGRPLPAVEPPIDQDDVAIIMYTSGTTGDPKGVVSTHRGVMSAINSIACLGRLAGTAAAMAAAAGATAPTTGGAKTPPSPTPPQPPPSPQDAMLVPVPLFHATGSHAIFLASFLTGRKLVLMYKWDAATALRLVEAERVTSFTGVPTMSLELVSHPDFDKYDTSSLRSIGGGGAPPPKKLGSLVAAKTKGRAGSGQGYGLTETNAISVLASSEDTKSNPSSCGRPTVLVELKVCDPDDPAARALAPGSVGELCLKSACNMKEYWGKAGKTEEAVTPDGWFRSGDIARVDEKSYVYILDRAKDLIIRGGENISCAEVESALYDHPAVAECAVFGLPDERLGEVVAAAVVVDEKHKAGLLSGGGEGGGGGGGGGGAALRAFCIERIAKFKAPALIFVWNDSQLPRGATGKIPKRTIKKALLDDHGAPRKAELIFDAGEGGTPAGYRHDGRHGPKARL